MCPITSFCLLISNNQRETKNEYETSLFLRARFKFVLTSCLNLGAAMKGEMRGWTGRGELEDIDFMARGTSWAKFINWENVGFLHRASLYLRYARASPYTVESPDNFVAQWAQMCKIFIMTTSIRSTRLWKWSSTGSQMISSGREWRYYFDTARCLSERHRLLSAKYNKIDVGFASDQRPSSELQSRYGCEWTLLVLKYVS